MADEQVKDSRERECKDVFMLILFAAFWVAMIICMGFGFSEGDPKRLVYPMDFQGRLCGIDEQVKNCRYVAWMEVDTIDIAAGGSDMDICVPACAGNSTNTPFDYSCYPGHNFEERVMPADHEIFRRCIPDSLTEAAEAHFTSVSGSDGMADIQKSMGIIILCAFLAVAFSFIWLELIKRYAHEMIWGTVFGVLALGVGFLAWIWKKVYDGRTHAVTGEDSEEGFLYMAIIFTVLFVILLGVIVYLRSRIGLTGELLEEAGIAVRAMPLLVLFPILPFVVMILFFILWGYAALFIASAGSVPPSGNERFNPDETVHGMLGFHFFALVWNLLFIVAVQDTTVAGAVATWYYTRDKTNLASPISTALGNTMKFNLGSIAFGSLLVAIVKIITMIFEMMRKATGNENASGFSKFVSNCTGCFVRCFDRFIAFISRNALIHVAIYNTSFCEGAKSSFRLITENADKVFAVNTVGDFFLFVCKFTVCAFSGLICMVILDNHYPEVGQPAIPAAIVVVLAWIVSCQFFGTIEMAVDTILICFCHEEDEVDRNSAYKPYMSDDLKAFVEKSQRLVAKVGDEAVN